MRRKRPASSVCMKNAKETGASSHSWLLTAKKKAEVGGTAVIVSSSGYLEAVCRKSIPGSAVSAVMPPGAMAFMLSLVPGVALSMHSLQRLLFDPGFGQHIGLLERRALRVIQASEQHSLPFSRRHMLREGMQKDLVKIAASRGESVTAVSARYQEEQPPEFFQLVADNVDRISKSRAEEENRALMAENEALKKKVQVLQRKNATRQNRTDTA
jgi:hypothetical protein